MPQDFQDRERERQAEQNLLLENLNKPANHPDISSIFSHFESGSHVPASRAKN